MTFSNRRENREKSLLTLLKEEDIAVQTVNGSLRDTETLKERFELSPAMWKPELNIAIGEQEKLTEKYMDELRQIRREIKNKINAF